MRSVINEILTEGRVEDAKEFIAKNYATNEDNDYSWVVDYLDDNDPSGNNKYLMWMVKRMVDDNEDTTNNTEGALIELVTDFHKPGVQARVPSKDINYYKNTEELRDAVVIALEGMREKTSKQEVSKGTNKIVEDDRWLILHPATKESSCKYGQGTKWCTAMEDASHYDDYTKNGNLYYIIDKSKDLGRYYKVALYYTWENNEEWYDAEDNKLSDNMVELIESMLPEGYMEKIQQYHDDYEMERIGQLDPSELHKFFQTWISLQLENTPSRIKRYFPLITRSGKWEWNSDHWKNGNTMLLQTEVNNIPIDVYATPFHDDGKYTPVEIEVLTNLKQYQQTGDEGVEEMVEKFDVPTVFGNRNQYELAAPIPSYNVAREEIENCTEVNWDKASCKEGWSMWGQYTHFLKEYLNSDRVVQFIKEHTGLEDITIWNSGRYDGGGYKFENIKTAKLANSFINYIKKAEEKGMKATRKEFLEFINKPATPGYFSQFFSAIQDAGIVEKNRMGRSFYYTLGPNYEAFTQGRLKRASE